jgi:NADH-quinone oxidoreductase subunit E
MPSKPYSPATDLDRFEKMNQELIRMMPREVASAVNLLVHPVAGVAAMSAFGFGLASHAFGAWAGALSGAAEASQRLLQPFVDDFDARVAALQHTGSSSIKARAATRTLIAEAQSFAQEVTDIAAKEIDSAAHPATEGESRDATLHVNFRQPEAIDMPAEPSDLKAISGIGPKLEKVLNGLGIWTYAQIAAWTPEEIAWVEDYLSLSGRVGRDGWTAQASELAVRT